ncbi:MAG: thermonuclease family protein [Dehalococcoidia bacterium]|nr:thermonuclease family protein [Dehalococcoidia bacterium]
MRSIVRPRFKSGKPVVLAVFLAGLAIGLGGGYFFSHGSYTPVVQQALVVRVIDGDTVEVAGGQRIRYLDIDTPEVGRPHADEATRRNEELVGGKVVGLQRGNRDKDEFGRLLRYVYVDGTFVNAELVAEGFARAYIFDSDERYAQVLVQLEQYAKLRNIGIWKQ